MTAGRAAAALRRPGLWTGAAVFALALGLYLQGTKAELLDSRYALLVSESLISRGSWDVAPHLGPPATSVEGEEARRRAWIRRGRGGGPGPYQLVREGEARLYYFPPGTPLLSAPLLAAARPFGYGVLHPDGRYAYQKERQLQEVLAPLVTAGALVLLLGVARRELPWGWSLGIVLSAAVGSSLWSVASRMLWSHTWSVVLLAAAWLELLRWEDGGKPRPAWLGALLVAAFWVRPTNALVALGVTLVVALRHRRALLRLIATGALGLAAFVATALAVWGEPLPPYFSAERTSEISAADALDSLAGLLVSPTRGLFSFSPILLLIPIAFAVWGIPRSRRLLALVAVAILSAHLALYGIWEHWWAGSSYGPRLLTDFVPFLVWLGALALRSAREGPRPGWLKPVLVAVAIPLLAWSALSHGAGVFSRRIMHSTSMSGGRSDPHLLWQWRRAPALQQLRGWGLAAGGGGAEEPEGESEDAESDG